MTARSALLLALLLPALAPATTRGDSPARPPAFRNEFAKPDRDGQHINAHGGGILFHEGTYYWFGEARNERGRHQPPSQGVACYSSPDLREWKNEGLVLPVSEDPDSDIAARGCIIERPKVVHNAGTGQFVLWFHLELKGQGYAAARTAVAVAEQPTGPFTFLRSLRPNAGHWPIDFPASRQRTLTPEEAERRSARSRRAIEEGVFTRRDHEGGQMSRDMTVFVDDDGSAYLVSSTEENYTLAVHELTPDYLDFTGKWTRVAPAGHNEAPAILKRDGTYHLLASGCTGWDPNEARWLSAESIWGPWEYRGNPCTGGSNPVTGMGPDRTFGGQSTFLFPVPGKQDAWIAMFDVWRPRSLITSGHLWLPVRFENDQLRIEWREAWDLDEFAD